ncbi:hypothetical protein [Amycolatopsis sp. NPDC003731]
MSYRTEHEATGAGGGGGAAWDGLEAVVFGAVVVGDAEVCRITVGTGEGLGASAVAVVRGVVAGASGSGAMAACRPGELSEVTAMMTRLPMTTTPPQTAETHRIRRPARC